MSSKKDLVEAHAFNRRRLVSAFVSGAPGGREVEPVRYGRTLVGGLVLAVFLVAGAGVLGLIKPTIEDDWNENTLVIGEESGSRFVALESGLYPVINTTSARLLLAQEDGTLDVRSVPDDLIAEQTLQPTIGITGAPDILPAPDNLIDSGWTACTSGGADIKLRIASQPLAAALPNDALLVESDKDGKRYVITGDRRYPLPSGTRGDDVIRALGLSGATSFHVDGLWLDLVALGPELASFSVPDEGDRLPTGEPGVDRVGTPLLIDGDHFILVNDGGKPGLLPISEFAYSMYTAEGTSVKRDEQELEPGQLTGLSNAELDLPFVTEWPQDPLRQWEGTAPCMILERTGSVTRSGRLATPAPQTASLLVPTKGSGLSTVVEQGHGALVEATTAGVSDEDSKTAVLIDSTGTRFTVGTAGDDDVAKIALGYGETTPTRVPKPWTELVRGDGPALNPTAATERVTAPVSRGR